MKNSHPRLSHRNHLLNEYIPKLKRKEEELQKMECRYSKVSYVHDATGRGGDV